MNVSRELTPNLANTLKSYSVDLLKVVNINGSSTNGEKP
jgi:hypothetical protein